MDYSKSTALENFNNEVGIKFQLYNSLFSSLPFHRIEKTGIHLALLLTDCEEGYDKGKSPVEIMDEFFTKNYPAADEKTRIDVLFRFIQYAERQVVLFDALEDAAFRQVNDMNGPGTLKSLEAELAQSQLQDVLAEKLKDFAIRLVLTAHPTQFYPGEVLGIIHDLSDALKEDNAALVNQYLMQLGKTPFFKHDKPTPYDEAISLIWYLEFVFYPAAGEILSFMKAHFAEAMHHGNSIIRLGFWPGGDRDGNPFVTVDGTLKVADALRSGILRCYYNDVRKLRRRLTFKGVTQILAELEKNLYSNVFIPGSANPLTKQDILSSLHKVQQMLYKDHRGLFASLVSELINKVEVFGMFFASLDIRQESTVHALIYSELAAQTDLLPKDYDKLPEEKKIEAITSIHSVVDDAILTDKVQNDTLKAAGVIKTIQQTNGEEGCHRFIISQCNSALNVIEVYGLFLLNGWKPEELTVDIVPLFETIDDLKHAADIMRMLYSNKQYRQHLQRRGNLQTIMVGFSDGTKDGGYLMANWSIYKAKDELTALSRSFDVDVAFFDGRGGPPARGGGKTHKFYASMGQNIANKEIQLTVQGQTVSSNFGIIDSAQYNIEQMVHAGLSSSLFTSRLSTMDKHEEALLNRLAEDSLQSYLKLKNHPNFFDYLGHASPLRFYADTNIGSRPAKRGGSAKLSLKDLRAIPYVGSWSQLKQNVTGYYGVGTALKKMDDEGKWNEVKDLYRNSLFFKTLMDNCEMAMKKCFFPLTAFLANHPVYGAVWKKIYKEYELSRSMILKLSGHKELMSDYPVEQMSVQMRERIILPVTTIQQYAITKVRYMEEQVMPTPLKEKYEKLVMRCSFGIINAGRNSA
ncbi:MAG: phosphoenolpyruvate carboxylase [Bacteroidota bacterium]